MLVKYMVKVPSDRNIFHNDGNNLSLRFNHLKASDIIRESHISDVSKFNPEIKINWIGDTLYITYDVLTDFRGKLLKRSTDVYVQIRS